VYFGISKHANQRKVLEKRLNHVDEDSNRDYGKRENIFQTLPIKSYWRRTEVRAYYGMGIYFS